MTNPEMKNDTPPPPDPAIKRSLLRDMTISLALVIVLVSLSITGWNYWSFSRKAERSYQLKADEYLAYLQESLEPPLWHMSDESVQRIGMSLGKNEIVAKLIIKDHRDRIIFSQQPAGAGKLVERQGPVFHGQEKIGHVQLGISTLPFVQSNRLLLRTNVVAMISIGLALMGMAGLLLKLFLMNPLSYLNERIAMIAEGRYQFEFRQAKQKEINDIIVKFNEMASRVKNREESLLEANEKLEQEIKERKLVESALRESEERFRTMVSNMPAAVYRASGGPPRNMIFLSNPILEISGRTAAELTDNPDHGFDTMILAEDFPAVQREIGKALAASQPYQLEYRIVNKSGHVTWVFDRGRGCFGEQGALLWLDGAINDITSRKENEIQLRRLVTAVEHAADSIIISDTSGGIEYANPAAEKTSGYLRAELTGKNFLSLKPDPDTAKPHQDIRAALGAGGIWSGLTLMKRKDGSVYKQEETISPIRRGSGTIIGYVSVGRDVTEQEKLKEQLMHAERMEAVGTLAGGIAHDFNNILHGILGNAGVAKTHELPAGHPAVYSLDQIIKAAERASELVNQILTFSRQKEPALSELNLHPIIKEVVKLLRASLPVAIEIRLSLAAAADRICGSPSGIYRVLMNLCTNAAHAMRHGSGGVLSIGTRNRHVPGPIPFAGGDLAAGDYIELTVKDTGEGIDGLIKDRIFEPYFTTKPVGEGSGLGLSVVHGIVKSMCGHISVESGPGQGTLFTIWLPQAEKRLKAPAQNGTAAAGGHERVLFVDDEALITDMARRLLEGLGYAVSVTSTSTEALRLLMESPRAYDLLMTDMTIADLIDTRKKLLHFKLIAICAPITQVSRMLCRLAEITQDKRF